MAFQAAALYDMGKDCGAEANAAKFLEDNPEIGREIEQQIRDKLLVVSGGSSKVNVVSEDLVDADL